jgi:hypothetical protein
MELKDRTHSPKFDDKIYIYINKYYLHRNIYLAHSN